MEFFSGCLFVDVWVFECIGGDIDFGNVVVYFYVDSVWYVSLVGLVGEDFNDFLIGLEVVNGECMFVVFGVVVGDVVYDLIVVGVFFGVKVVVVGFKDFGGGVDIVFVEFDDVVVYFVECGGEFV